MARVGIRAERPPTVPALYVLPSVPERPVPPAPEYLSEAASAIWAELWSGPVSALWTEDEEHAVALLARLTVLSRHGAISPPFVAQYLALRERLLLSPRARRLHGVSLAGDEPEPAPVTDYGEARRAELLRLAANE